MVEVAGAVLAVKELFKYNRKAFMFDAKLRQEREFQEQDMRVEQFALYREDVRDLVELTVAKMDLYLVSTALLIDKTMMLICKQKEAFPPEENHVPEWAIALNSLSLASGSFFLLLSLWLAMYASISAQSFGTRLLTQYVRLPTASQEQIDSATAEATQFEAKGVGELVKVPFTTPQRDESTVGAAGPGDAGAPAQLPPLAAPPPRSAAQPPDAGPSADDDEAAWNLLPSAMLEHIRLYRKVQLNWQAYDAYARVSLFVGANSLLYACLYWSMGNFLNLTHERFRDNCFPALATALIFSAIQLTITRLDLRLPKKYMTYITLTVVLSPVVTVLGLLFHADLIGRMAKGETVQPWRRHLMDFLALMAHSIQALLMALVLRAAWPERSGTDEHQALLPGRFRSTLYLDVFGWLLNPGGPGAGARRRSRDSAAAGESWRSAGSPTGSPPADSDSDASSEHVPSEMRTPMRRSRGAASPRREVNARNRRVTFAAWRASLANVFTQDRGQRVPRDREIGLGEGLGRDLRDQFSPRSSPRTSFTRGSAAGDSYRRSSLTRGREPAPSAPTSMTQELRFGGAEALPRDVMEDMDDPANPGVAADAFGLPAESVPERAPVPGEHPWQAFLLGTSVILGLWVLSTVWALGPLLGLTSGWARGPKPNATAPERLGPRTRRPLPAGAAGLGGAPPARRARRAAAHAAGLPRAAAVGRLRVRSGAGDCRPAVSTAGVGTACPAGGAPSSRPCVLALLRRGGRAVTLCQLRPRGAGVAAAALRVGSLRVAAGAPALQSLAVGWRPGARGLGVRGLQFVGRAAGGALLSLWAKTVSGPSGGPARQQLTPEFELDPGSGPPPQQACAQCGSGELLMIAGEVLLSIEPAAGAPAGSGESCAAPAGFRVRAWDLLSGEREVGWLPQQGAWRWSAAEALQGLGAPRGAGAWPNSSARGAELTV